MRLAIFMGTRPEVIKLAPLILEAQRRDDKLDVIMTGQHTHLVQPLLKFFAIEPTKTLQTLIAGQTLTALSARLLTEMDTLNLRPDAVVVQGDTTTAFMVAYWAFLNKIPVAHVEAGLRTYDLSQPFPEEANRQLISRLADWHFVPTETARQALLSEGVRESAIHAVGNTAIGALLYTLQRLAADPSLLDAALFDWVGQRRLVLVTTHRRENFGESLEQICRGIREVVDSADDLCAVIPLHPNPNVRPVLERILGQHARIRLVEPLTYFNFVGLMRRSDLLLTDSGGIQEEGPSLRKPIVVMRETTERPEGVAAGFATLAGAQADRILACSLEALKHGCQGRGENPYGDGKTSPRILDVLMKAQ